MCMCIYFIWLPQSRGIGIVPKISEGRGGARETEGTCEQHKWIQFETK